MNIIQYFVSNNTGLYSPGRHLSTAYSHFFPLLPLFGTMPGICPESDPFPGIIHKNARWVCSGISKDFPSSFSVPACMKILKIPPSFSKNAAIRKILCLSAPRRSVCIHGMCIFIHADGKK